jgi:hypothetical protein
MLSPPNQRNDYMTTAREKLGLAELPDPHGTIAYAIERLAKSQEATAGTARLVSEAFRAALAMERRQAIVDAMAFCEASGDRWPFKAAFCVARLQEFLDAQPKETSA